MGNENRPPEADPYDDLYEGLDEYWKDWVDRISSETRKLAEALHEDTDTPIEIVERFPCGEADFRLQRQGFAYLATEYQKGLSSIESEPWQELRERESV